WQAIKPCGRSAFAVRDLPVDTPKKLFVMGFITNLANPKIAIMYLSLLPQFLNSGHGSVLLQSLMLGSVQISISLAVNVLIVVMASSISAFLVERPLWQMLQRWVMGTVLAGLAVKMAYESRK
ncbi:MAG: LysE family translocator, partial [Burkholderiales bacterium]|nr:LysE family translocator [Burkholderiales bacterium]